MAWAARPGLKKRPLAGKERQDLPGLNGPLEIEISFPLYSCRMLFDYPSASGIPFPISSMAGRLPKALIHQSKKLAKFGQNGYSSSVASPNSSLSLDRNSNSRGKGMSKKSKR